MNPDRFAAELPGLFDDFPQSERPSGRRFDDLVEGLPNLATEDTLAVVGLAASLLDPGERYVEAGTYMGASLIAAARGNESAELVAIDNFHFGPTEVAGRSLPAASRAALEANLERFGVRATVLEGDSLEVLRSGALDGLAGRRLLLRRLPRLRAAARVAAPRRAVPRRPRPADRRRQRLDAGAQRDRRLPRGPAARTGARDDRGLAGRPTLVVGGHDRARLGLNPDATRINRGAIG